MAPGAGHVCPPPRHLVEDLSCVSPPWLRLSDGSQPPESLPCRGTNQRFYTSLTWYDPNFSMAQNHGFATLRVRLSKTGLWCRVLSCPWSSSRWGQRESV